MLAPMAGNANKRTGGKTMSMTRRLLLGAAAATPLHRAHAASPEPIRIGVLTDLSGPYCDVAGPTSVLCARQAVAEFTAANPSIPSIQVNMNAGRLPAGDAEGRRFLTVPLNAL